MQHETIADDSALRQYCEDLSRAKTICFDTEFVSEHTFRPLLCLVQVAADDRLAIIDPLSIASMTPFWETLVCEGHETIVHSGRGEVEFCLQAAGRLPTDLFDVQLAAGLAGAEYPAGYGSLVSRLLGQSANKNETRTDWRRRPLSSRQIEYALDDVRHLRPLRNILHAQLQELGRLDWLVEEMDAWVTDIRQSLGEERWWRVSGNASLGGRSLAIVRELWRWRQAEAQRRDRPPRTILRDDLIVEMARRQTADVKQIGALRGMEWKSLRSRIPEFAECIQRALESPETESPNGPSRPALPQLAVLGQFLASALGGICRQMHLAPALVGGPNDVRDLVVYLLDKQDSQHRETPTLARGWRASVIGRVFEDLLAGKTAIRVGNPNSAHPLVIEPWPGRD